MKIKFSITSKVQNGFPVFIGFGGFFLFVMSLDGSLTWVIGTSIGDASKIILKNTESPVSDLIPSAGWLYLDAGEWKIDELLIFATIPTGGIYCRL